MTRRRTVRLRDRLTSVAGAYPEIAATLGLLARLVWWPLGVAADVGSTVSFAGAAVTHLRGRDDAIAPAAALLLASRPPLWRSYSHRLDP